MDPRGRVVLVTGAARGIGAATARALAARGARVALVGLEPDALRAVATTCGPAATWHEADVADMDALQAAVGDTLAAHGGLDVVFANAGIAISGPAHRLDPADVSRQLEVNLLGAFFTARATAEALIAARGYLLFNASLAALGGLPALGPYTASKAGLEALAGVMRTELAHHGVAVGVAYFGWVATDLIRDVPPRVRVATIGVDDAAAAVVRGVKGRRGTVVAPRWLAPALPLRGIVRPLVDVVARRYAPAIERAWERRAAEHGVHDASRPTGPSRTGT